MRKILILGGSQGLGLALACRLPRSGDKLWVVSRKSPPEYIFNQNWMTNWIEADLSDLSSIQAIHENVKNEKFNLIIYNAGIYSNNFDAMNDQDIIKMINVNTTGLLLISKYFKENLRLENYLRSNFVIITSTSSLEQKSSNVAYVASKYAARGAAFSIAHWLKDEKIGVVALAPGWLNTDPYIKVNKESWTPPMEASAVEDPFRRIQCEEIVNAIIQYENLPDNKLPKEIIIR